jgi:hypothetical protein
MNLIRRKKFKEIKIKLSNYVDEDEESKEIIKNIVEYF